MFLNSQNSQALWSELGSEGVQSIALLALSVGESTLKEMVKTYRETHALGKFPPECEKLALLTAVVQEKQGSRILTSAARVAEETGSALLAEELRSLSQEPLLYSVRKVMQANPPHIRLLSFIIVRTHSS